MRVSVAIPAYNEETVLPELLRRVGKVLDSIPGGPHEIIVVDDGSADRTGEILGQASQDDSRIAGIVFSRNFGHQAALAAALDHATGDVVIMMDGNLKTLPRSFRNSSTSMRKETMSSMPGEWAARKRGGCVSVTTPFTGCSEVCPARSCLWTREISGSCPGELSTKFAGCRNPTVICAVCARGLDSGRRAYRSSARSVRPGEPKYNLTQLFKLAADAIFSFSVVPLRFAAIVGMGAICLCGIYTLYALYIKLIHGETPQGFTALIVSITFLAGVQLFFMGIVRSW